MSVRERVCRKLTNYRCRLRTTFDVELTTTLPPFEQSACILKTIIQTNAPFRRYRHVALGRKNVYNRRRRSGSIDRTGLSFLRSIRSEVNLGDDTSRRESLVKTAALAAALVTVATSSGSAQQNASSTKIDFPPLPEDALRKAQTVIDALRQNAQSTQVAAGQSSPVRSERTALSSRDPKFEQQIQTGAAAFANVTNGDSPATTFRFSSKDEDLLFRMQQAEALLGQMASLLERGLATQGAWNGMNAAAFNVRLQLENYFEQDRIHQEETLAGYYEHLPRETSLQASADLFAQAAAQGQAFALKFINDNFYGDAIKTTLLDAAGILAFLSHSPDRNPPPNAPADGGFALYNNPVDNNQSEGSAVAASSASRFLTANSVNLQQAWLAAQNSAIEANLAVLDQRAKSTSVKDAWETKNAGFRLRRTELTRHLADVKSEAYTLPGGPLNYPEQMTRLESQFHQDFRDALARVPVGAEGLNKLYGFTVDPPASVTAVLSGGQPTAETFNECLLWVRDATSYLIRFFQTDQRCCFSVSLRQRLGNAEFESGRAVPDSATWTVNIPRELFVNQFFVRLRGVTLFTMGDNPAGVFTGVVRAPVKSFSEHFGKNPGDVVHQDLDQSNLRSSLAGRVTHRDDIRTPEVIGASALYNASPFGDWQIKLSGKSVEGFSVDAVQDVILEMHLAMRMSS